MAVPLPVRLNQPERENSLLFARAPAFAGLTTFTPLALAVDLFTPPPTTPDPAVAETAVEPALTATPPETAFASESPPWMTTA